MLHLLQVIEKNTGKEKSKRINVTGHCDICKLPIQSGLQVILNGNKKENKTETQAQIQQHGLNKLREIGWKIRHKFGEKNPMIICKSCVENEE
jgi:hypothetical protein